MLTRREIDRMHKRGKLTTAWTLVLALVFALFVAGCSDDDKSSNTEQGLSHAQGTGTVTGLVVDTNGNPLSGVSVYMLDKSTTTNAGGIYTFKKVPVSTVHGADQQFPAKGSQVDACPECQKLLITVAAPSGYLGATVAAYPYAQFDGSNDYTAASGDKAGEKAFTGDVTEGNNKVVTFVDGFAVQAQCAVLPKLGATVSGTLRDCETGKPLENVQVNLDFYASVCGSKYFCGEDGQCTFSDGIVYASPNYVTFTNSDGKFTFTNLPFDSYLDLLVPNYEEDDSGRFEMNGHTVQNLQLITDGVLIINEDENKGGFLDGPGGLGGSVDDTDYDYPAWDVETVDVNNPLGTIYACEVRDEGDVYPPLVVKVNGVYTVMQGSEDNCSVCDGYMGSLEEGVDQTFEVVFSECLQDKIDSSSVIVRDCTAGAYVDVASASLNADGTIMTVTLVAPIPAGHEFTMFLETDDFKDLAGNHLYDPGSSLLDIRYDEGNIGSAAWADYFALCLHAFKEANLDPDPVTDLVQLGNDCDPANEGIWYDSGDFPDLFANSAAFNDILAGNNSINQLNFQANPTGGGVYGTAELLDHRASWVDDPGQGCGGLDLSDLVNNNLDIMDIETARVRFSFGNASYYTLTGPGTCTLKKGTGSCANITAGPTVEAVFFAASPGDKVTVTPYDDFNFAGVKTTLTLIDNVVPTTALQKAYGNTCFDSDGCCVRVSGGQDFAPDYGDGAELSGDNPADVPGGIPLFPVTPRLLIDQALAPGYDHPGGIFNLYTLNSPDDDNDDDLSPAGIMDNTDHPSTSIDDTGTDDGVWWDYDGYWRTPGDPSDNGHDPVYDATAFAAWTAQGISRVVGVGFTENLGPLLGDPLYTGSVALSGFAVLNDVPVDDGGLSPDPDTEDLVIMTVPEVLDLANLDHGAVLDFTDVVQDLQGNIARECAGAQVQICDLMPPFVTRAWLDQTGITIEFNEDVDLDTTTSIEIVDPNGVESEDDIPLTNATQPTTNSIFIPIDDVTMALSVAPSQYFSPDFAYPEAAYDSEGGSGDLEHAIIDTQYIADLHGNTWAQWEDGSDCILGGQILVPSFAAVDLIGPFDTDEQFTIPTLECGTTFGTITYFVHYTHPIDWAATFANGVTNRTEAAAYLNANLLSGPTGSGSSWIRSHVFLPFNTDFTFASVSTVTLPDEQSIQFTITNLFNGGLFTPTALTVVGNADCQDGNGGSAFPGDCGTTPGTNDTLIISALTGESTGIPPEGVIGSCPFI